MADSDQLFGVGGICVVGVPGRTFRVSAKFILRDDKYSEESLVRMMTQNLPDAPRAALRQSWQVELIFEIIEIRNLPGLARGCV